MGNILVVWLLIDMEQSEIARGESRPFHWAYYTPPIVIWR